MVWWSMMVIILTSESGLCHGDMQSDVAKVVSGVDSIAWLHQPMAEFCGRSLTACAVACMTDYSCVGFSVTGSSAPGERHCRCHSAFDVPNDGAQEPGARVYHFVRRAERDSRTEAGEMSPEPGDTTKKIPTNLTPAALTGTTSTTTTVSTGATTAATEIKTTAITTTTATTTTATTTTTTTTTTATTTSTTATTKTTTPNGWLYNSCSGNPGMCQMYDVNSYCLSLYVESHCVCQPAFFYSTGKNSCVPTCPEKDVLNDTVEYPWCSISSNPPTMVLYPMEVGSFDGCRAHCYAEVKCRFFSYLATRYSCTLYFIAPTSVLYPMSLNLQPYCWDSTIYVRKCA